ncbi:hypothetical protein PIB30_037140, partial [Stylosanthes scabra]|nr:hypothetical protein [Stylosanthes scabra]
MVKKQKWTKRHKGDERLVIGYSLRAPIDARFAATRSSRHPLRIHHTCNGWELEWRIEHENGDWLCLNARWRDRGSRVYIELGIQGSKSTPSSKSHELPRIESSRLVHEPICFYPDFKFNVQNALRVDSSSSKSILISSNMILK